MNVMAIVRLLIDAGIEFWTDKAPRLGAALAYYIALSLSPLLIVVIAFAGMVFGPDAARGELSQQLHSLLGPDAARAVESMLAAHHAHGGHPFAPVIGIVVLLAAATGIFAQLQDALNTVWGVRDLDLPGGPWSFIRDRLLSFLLVCLMGGLLLVSVMFSTMLAALSGWIEALGPARALGLRALNELLSFCLTMVLFAMIFKLLPAVRPRWTDVWIGAAVTAALFALGKALIGIYLGRVAVGSAYGAAGSFVVLLVWIYYSTQIVLYGAEFTQVYASRYGSGLRKRSRSVSNSVPAEPHASSRV